MKINAFRAWRPQANLIEEVAGPPYDVVSREEARAIIDKSEKSFMHIIRADADLPEEAAADTDRVIEKAVENLHRAQQEHWLVQDDQPAVYLYAQTMDAHMQYGLVCCCHVTDYDADIIKKHEKTRAATEAERTRHVDRLNANTGPIFLTFRSRPDIDALILQAAVATPEYQFTAPDGVQHRVWQLPNPAEWKAAFEAVPTAYVADGHHRSASAANVARLRREANPDHTGDEEYNWFMSVLFPSNQLKVMAYNRLVHDLNGQTPKELMAKIAEKFRVLPAESAAPAQKGHIHIYMDGAWHKLVCKEPPTADPVESLDVSVLQNHVLAPLLGIEDPRKSDRITFVGGIRGTDYLEKAVDEGRGAVAFSMYPVSVDELMDVADAGMIMPPKSTWFEPKLSSGLFVHTLD